MAAMSGLSTIGMILVAATVASGLFGSAWDRAAVATLAWIALGVQAWADYSRHGDLQNGYLVIQSVRSCVGSLRSPPWLRRERTEAPRAGIPRADSSSQ